MAKGEIVIHEELCKGCAFCVHFCPKKCVTMTKNIGPGGNLLPAFSEPDNCNACGICGFMCPDMAIDVYKIVESSA